MDSSKTAARRGEKKLRFGFGVTYIRGLAAPVFLQHILISTATVNIAWYPYMSTMWNNVPNWLRIYFTVALFVMFPGTQYKDAIGSDYLYKGIPIQRKTVSIFDRCHNVCLHINASWPCLKRQCPQQSSRMLVKWDPGGITADGEYLRSLWEMLIQALANLLMYI